MGVGREGADPDMYTIHTERARIPHTYARIIFLTVMKVITKLIDFRKYVKKNFLI